MGDIDIPYYSRLNIKQLMTRQFRSHWAKSDLKALRRPLSLIYLYFLISWAVAWSSLASYLAIIFIWRHPARQWLLVFVDLKALSLPFLFVLSHRGSVDNKGLCTQTIIRKSSFFFTNSYLLESGKKAEKLSFCGRRVIQVVSCSFQLFAFLQ